MYRSFIRSALFVPASRPERVPKALASGADVVIIDLEDGVAKDGKGQARQALDEALTHYLDGNVPIAVRINAPESEECDADLALCARHPGIAALVVPKTESGGALRAVLSRCERPIWAQIESARGLSRIEEIASSKGVERLSFGPLDLALDLGVTLDTSGGEAVLDQARYALIMQSRLAGLDSPLAGTLPTIDDKTAIAATARRSRDMGFGGMLCIHPAQLGPVHEVFAPTVAELDWARRVVELAARSEAVFQIDGKMVDAPVIELARRMLASDE
ncbi:HpcH/HpaI aldolase/citrate lyase family protein [Phytohalomonas tamaricis]|uniref:HpcH/HpaI aldolase/citrate lyase family protein n=1 Tax=Phytohalomonas tamaricis TaxID=2081032 RepID=UPI000D0B7B2D|nr:CoA ester lyase [Phytohalomonas tamaricis]